MAGSLGDALQTCLSHPVQLTCAGRTDAGVHARRQVVSFDTTRFDVDCARLARSLNRLCGPEIVVRSVAEVSADFDARFSALTRHYRYSILNSECADPLRRHVVWHLSHRLDIEAMNAAASHFIGLHHFGSFCRRHESRSLERRVLAADWVIRSDLLIFRIEASSFCHQMVRSLVGTMVDVGRGDRSPGEIPEIIAARDRHVAPTIAPPQGLCLWDVTYP